MEGSNFLPRAAVVPTVVDEWDISIEALRDEIESVLFKDAVQLPFELKKERDLPEHGIGHLVFPNRCTGHGAMCSTWLRGKPG